MKKLVLLRHGESQWNLENRFTGWTNVDLTKKGEEEAKKAGELLNQEAIEFDVVHTSLLKRANRTMEICINEMGLSKVSKKFDWRLNERHYGGLQGLNKAETAEKHGDEQVLIWRRSYDIPPPMMAEDDTSHPRFDSKYDGIDELPSSESLKDTLARVKPYWQDKILPDLLGNKDVLVVAHGNSIRAMVKMLDNLSDKDIVDVNIPTGIPLAYNISDNNIEKIGYLGDEEAINNLAKEVEMQSKITDKKG